MFDIGFSELVVIFVVALLVLGPERLPKAARFAGLWVRRARAQWYSVKAEFENELADEDMRRSIQRAREELREAQAEIQRSNERLRAELHEAEARLIRSDITASGKDGAPVLPPPAGPRPASGMPPADDHGRG